MPVAQGAARGDGPRCPVCRLLLKPGDQVEQTLAGYVHTRCAAGAGHPARPATVDEAVDQARAALGLEPEQRRPDGRIARRGAWCARCRGPLTVVDPVRYDEGGRRQHADLTQCAANGWRPADAGDDDQVERRRGGGDWDANAADLERWVEPDPGERCRALLWSDGRPRLPGEHPPPTWSPGQDTPTARRCENTAPAGSSICTPCHRARIADTARAKSLAHRRRIAGQLGIPVDQVQ